MDLAKAIDLILITSLQKRYFLFLIKSEAFILMNDSFDNELIIK